MKRFKSTIADRFFFPDGPPAFKHEIVANLEEIADAGGALVDSFDQNFSNISETLGHQAEEMASALGEGLDSIQSHLSDMSDEISDGLWEANYTLLDIAGRVTGVHGAVEQSRKEIIQAIQNSTVLLSSRIDQTNQILQAQLSRVNLSLNAISGDLSELKKLISSPNKTRALELADQARQNIAMNKKERAFRATEEAMTLSNGTSISVLAYHILSLSLFEDRIEALLDAYDDYARLVAFKLADPQSDKRVIVHELEATVYSVMGVMGSHYRRRVKRATLAIYAALDRAGNLTEHVRGLPLTSRPVRELISQRNFLREIHWSLLLTRYVVPKNEPDIYLEYFLYLSESGTLIETELTVTGLRHFAASGLFYKVMAVCLLRTCNTPTLEALTILFSVLPQETISLDDATLWMIRELVNKHSIDVNAELQKKLNEVERRFRQSVNQYRKMWDENLALLRVRESEAHHKLEQFAVEIRQERERFEREENVERLRTRIAENEKVIEKRSRIINAIVAKDGIPVTWPFYAAVLIVAALGYGTGFIQDQPFAQEFIQWFKNAAKGP